jgi:hypothetical protein
LVQFLIPTQHWYVPPILCVKFVRHINF